MSKSYPIAQNPLLLRSHRLMEAFAKSDDERDFYLDRVEGFILFVDLDKPEMELNDLQKELDDNPDRYCTIPKMTFYETKKFMEGFVNEKIYDIDTKEKLLDIISSKEARENFLDFIYDHLSELEKWQQYYQERSRIRIIEWLRQQNILFVFEEDLDLPKNVMEKLKRHLFEAKVAKDISSAREMLYGKAKTYYSNEALNPRPKRGRPPKQVAKIEIEPQVCVDLLTTVPAAVRPFLFIPDINVASITFSARYDSESQQRHAMRGSSSVKIDTRLQQLSERLDTFHKLASRLSHMQGLSSNDAEERRLKAISQRIEETLEQPEETVNTKRISGVVQGFLPKKKSGAEEKNNAKASVKTVTPLNKSKKK